MLEARRIVRIVVTLLIIAGIVWYAYTRLRPVSTGPQITLTDLYDGAPIFDQSIIVKGTAKHSARMEINEFPTLLSDDDTFGQRIAIVSGENIIHLKATDRFDRTQEITLRVFGHDVTPPTLN